MHGNGCLQAVLEVADVVYGPAAVQRADRLVAEPGVFHNEDTTTRADWL